MMRKTPKQKRSESTVDDISEAAIQLLDTAGAAKFTTNHVAERAGVSIGSLYRYFPDKGAILRYIVRREIKKMRTKALAIIAGSQASDADTLINEIIVHSTQNFGGRGAVVFQIRTLIEDDIVLRQEICEAQIEVLQSLHEKMMDITGKRRRPMSNAALAAAVDAFTTAVQTLARHSSDKSVDAVTRKRLLSSLLTALSEEEPSSER